MSYHGLSFVWLNQTSPDKISYLSYFQILGEKYYISWICYRCCVPIYQKINSTKHNFRFACLRIGWKESVYVWCDVAIYKYSHHVSPGGINIAVTRHCVYATFILWLHHYHLNHIVVCFIYFYKDIYECSSIPDVCSNHGFCTNIEGSYICTCEDGWGGTECDIGKNWIIDEWSLYV